MKGTRRAVLALCVMAGVLAGCNEETTRDVQYYLDHADERAAKLAECKNNPGEKALEANCINAAEALRQAGAQSRQMPAIPDITRGRR